jgi:hypothetical protein
MPGMSWSALLNSNLGPGTAVANTTSLTKLTPDPPFVLPANFVYSVGTSFTIKAFGVLSTTGTPTLILGVYYGGTGGTALAVNSAVTQGSAVTNVPWRLEYDLIFRSNGATAAAMGSGFVKFGASVSAWQTADEVPIPNTALATVSVDTTAAKEIALGATWSAASSSNTITPHGFKIWSDNL